MKFSVIVPNFNDGRSLGACLKSIQDQDYDDYEVFIYDNQSTDMSLDVADKFLSDKRFALFEAPTHYPHGSSAINKCMPYTTGDAISWINADDYLLPEYFSSLAPYLEDPEIGFVRIGIQAYDHRTPYEMMTFLPMEWESIEKIIKVNTVYPASPFRKKLFYDVGGMDETAIFWDWDYWIRVALDGVHFMGWKYNTCNKPLAVRKIHPGSSNPKGGYHTMDELQGLGYQQIMRKYLRDEKLEKLRFNNDRVH